ncbi:MAG: ABC transporter ATP-binding protein/permease [Oscillospiraceae bacterium]|jgi:ATP-binding cassette subfamily B protein|nr:ABC transporter ATP-binding protein/permease [Oscillospiraceae bacterium]
MNKKFKKLISYYKPYKKQLILDLSVSILASLIFVTVPTICRYITSEVLWFEKDQALAAISWLAALIGFLFLILFLCKRYIEHRGLIYATKIETDIENELFAHFQYHDFSFYNECKTGEIVSLFTADAFGLRNAIKRTPEYIMDIVIIFSCVFTFLFSNSKPLFAFILLALFALIFLFVFLIFPKIYKVTSSSRGIFSNIIGTLEEEISGIKTTQSFTNEKLAIEALIERNKTYLATVNKIAEKQSILDAGLLSFIIGMIPISTVIGMFFVINGNVAIAELVSIMLYIDLLIGPIFNLVHLNGIVREAIVGFSRIYDTLNMKPKILDAPNAVKLENISGNIEFKDATFHHEKSDKNILENLNLQIHAGEYIALVGSSGVGKSTLCNLIPRFYDTSNGEVLIDNINVKNIKLENLRKNIGFVQQDTFLFSGTILENIRYGKPNAGKEEIIESAKNAYAHNFIISFPDGYDTQIGQRGTRLSGGQKQRLAIARVFLKNPPILIFDEATSSLDNESEKFIQKSMEKLSVNRTTIVIAHRLSTIKNAKRILVMSDGKIAEEGTHDELVIKSGLYSEFYSLL